MRLTAFALAALGLAALAGCQPPPVIETPMPSAFPGLYVPPPPPPAVAGAEFEGPPPPSAFDDPQTIDTTLPPATMPPAPAEEDPDDPDAPLPLTDLVR